jgi:hypothetical protein
MLQIVFHDGTLQRVCGQAGVPADFDFADLPHVLPLPPLPMPFHPPGSMLPPYWSGPPNVRPDAQDGAAPDPDDGGGDRLRRSAMPVDVHKHVGFFSTTTKTIGLYTWFLKIDRYATGSPSPCWKKCFSDFQPPRSTLIARFPRLNWWTRSLL